MKIKRYKEKKYFNVANKEKDIETGKFVVYINLFWSFEI
jgi:hypothetical protein